MTLSQFIEKKLEEFDKRFNKDDGHHAFQLVDFTMEDIKDYFSSAIKEAVKEFAEEIRLEEKDLCPMNGFTGMDKRFYSGFNQAKNDLDFKISDALK